MTTNTKNVRFQRNVLPVNGNPLPYLEFSIKSKRVITEHCTSYEPYTLQGLRCVHALNLSEHFAGCPTVYGLLHYPSSPNTSTIGLRLYKLHNHRAMHYTVLSRLTPFWKIIAVYTENDKNTVNTPSRQNVSFQMMNQSANIIPTVL
jgi:hypothetical protein